MDNSDYNLTSLPPMMNVDGNGQLLMPLPNGQPHQVPPSEQQQEQQPELHHELQPLNPVSSASASLPSSIVQQFSGGVHTPAAAQSQSIVAPDYSGGNVSTHLPLTGFFGASTHLDVLNAGYTPAAVMLPQSHAQPPITAALETPTEHDVNKSHKANSLGDEPTAILAMKLDQNEKDKGADNNTPEAKSVPDDTIKVSDKEGDGKTTKSLDDQTTSAKEKDLENNDKESTEETKTAEGQRSKDVEKEKPAATEDDVVAIDDEEDAEDDEVEEVVDEEEDLDEEEEEEEAEEDEGEAIIPDDGIPPIVIKDKEPTESAEEDEINEKASDEISPEANKTDEKGNENEKPPAEDDKSDKDAEAASSSTLSTRRKQQEEEVDENQCRVCCNKDNLVTLFKKMEDQQTVADMLMLICPSVHIAIKDFLPQFICNTCLDNVIKAVQLKQQCEKTEKELRKKLSRHKNKIRRPAGYVVIDAPLDSDPATDDEQSNDEEFKVSDIASVSPSEDSVSSEESDESKKKKKGRKRRKSSSKSSKSRGAKSGNGSSDEDDGDPIGNHKRKRSDNSSPEVFACDECDHVFHRKQSLVLHRKVHTNEREPIACKICGRMFKIKGAYRTHMERHRDEKNLMKCQKCSRTFLSNIELRRHMIEAHSQSGAIMECLKCKRKFVSASRLESHENRCHGNGKNKKGNDTSNFVVGQDLFKTVAPLTTTYWSDSYSD
ncbi:homeotic protein spalt-major [Musca domestica]|uniref:Homeotic protein spalt-major n=1 Tax=Musca domestica TaxID=7370 RepID=A0A1I8M2B8_MUSDO|nr:homeotic protein spalt-major [Musca domestica]